MVTYRYLSDKFLKPLHEKQQRQQEEALERGREEGREEGLEKGREEGREEERRLWADWNRRRLEAERDGLPFDEALPGMNGNQERLVKE